ncbi:PAS domain-containing protein [Lichenihabitans sp. Uapishka_5]|uniref:PAS domain-containing protein n=1 Tax=Lichenihabitans sp. Uapishka_5 TaxID=3037302 RepID=UPI0029E7F4ED|nr:PAS domain-containing protein [Lichenihabitans sp. Uapishka_5]MDX7950235.1 PAS domain-containing protein [Lichenihabitans sp. Uapishka_5]
MTTPEEAKELFSDLLISVTSFFRDAPAYAAMERRAVNAIFDDLDPEREEGVRAWVVGCATGEEAYSLAILFHEEAARRKLHPQVQIFATDLDEGALATAREGRYLRTIENDVSEERLARFFIDEGTHYRVRKELRESVLFATHSVIKEPPFLRLDLVSCRNLLIYLERSLQQQLCSIFHYGLKPGRYLFLGSAETADVATDLFMPLDREARIYGARPHAVQTLPVLPQFAAPERYIGTSLPTRVPVERTGLPAATHVAALERTAPASALVDDEQKVVHLSPSVGRFILLPAGPIPNLLPSMVRPELRLDLRLALVRALEAQEPTLTHPTIAVLDGERRRVSMHVMPVPVQEHMGAQALVFFLDGGSVPDAEAYQAAADTQPGEVQRLLTELKAMQEALVASRGGHEATVQDLRATNEELQSTNEEYRSTAEELETSKEELQSINEELHTVNAEMKSKLSSISVAHSDLQNLTTSTDIGTLFLDGDLRIKMFTPPIAELFNVTRADIGRVVTDFTHRLEYDGIEDDARRVLSDLSPIETEVRSKNGRWYVVRLRPYRTIEDRIDGTVVSFVDITARREAEQALIRSEEQLRALVRASSQVLYRMSPNWDEMRELVGGGFLPDTNSPDESWLLRYIPEDDHARVRYAVQAAIDAKAVFELEHRVRSVGGALGWTLSRAIPVFDDAGNIVEWFGSASEVTGRKHAEDALRESEERLRQFGEASQDVLWIRDADTLQWTYLTPAFETIYGLSRVEALSGDNYRNWVDLILPEDRAYAVKSIEQVREGGHVTFEYRIRRPLDGEVRWLRNTDFPMRDPDGQVRQIGGVGHDVTELKRVEAALRDSEGRLRTLIEGVPQLIWRSCAQGRWTWASPQWLDYTGQTQKESHGLGWLAVVHPDDHAVTEMAWQDADPHGRLNTEFRVRRASDGTWRWHQTRSVPVRATPKPNETAGPIIEWLGTTTDIEDLKRLQGQQHVLVGELQHRTRNLLAVVRNVARRSIDASAGRDEYDARLAALGRVQGFLSRSTAYAVPLADVVAAELHATGDGAADKVVVGGPAVVLPGESVQAVALALHELATNAVKYGAIAQPAGRLSVTWQLDDRDDGRRLVIDWHETGVVMPEGLPERRGYGTELITQALPYQLHAETALEFTPDGVRCQVILPSSAFRSPVSEEFA